MIPHVGLPPVEVDADRDGRADEAAVEHQAAFPDLDDMPERFRRLAVLPEVKQARTTNAGHDGDEHDVADVLGVLALLPGAPRGQPPTEVEPDGQHQAVAVDEWQEEGGLHPAVGPLLTRGADLFLFIVLLLREPAGSGVPGVAAHADAR